MNIHAGRTEQDIADFIADCEAKANGLQTWIFLDEINTCNHLGFINRLICHRRLRGVPIPQNIAFLAACNPYRLKNDRAMSAGLDIQQKKTPDKMSKLVYRVYPLPETMLDYLWDFGSLSAQDEELYVQSIFSKLTSCDFPDRTTRILVKSVMVAHEYLRRLEDVSAVSMRDVRRCEKLVTWFCEEIPNRPMRKTSVFSFGMMRSFFSSPQAEETPTALKAIILSIAHCYRSRLPTTMLRSDFDEILSRVFSDNFLPIYSKTKIQEVIKNEQLDYLERMELSEGIAKNETLLENIFVLLVCILLKMPIFLVGKPGSSKTLAVKIIESNLRGRDSKDPYFQLQNEVKIVSYQGSTSSTSEGLLQAFARAKSYATASDHCTVIVLIDEVGLAEISPLNPLKVLHHKLEDSDFEVGSNVGVVGLSNWSLDAAKMNRAIHISRPEPDIAQLHLTSKEIVKSIFGHEPQDWVSNILKSLSEAYLTFYKGQLQSHHPNFHGLRDFYSCVKQIAKSYPTDKVISEAISRNFNGLHRAVNAITPFDSLTSGSLRSIRSVKDLVSMNLKDKNCRHLLLVTGGDTILNMIDSIFKENQLESPRIIIGSKLPGDQCENYHYRLLSEIIECMELGTSLVLKDLDAIYGSLYDMLNQAYSLMAGKLHCRVALGAYSNPMCHVHENFKCVVIVDQSKVGLLDPPFLSRFEKQLLNFSSFLNSVSQLVLRRLKEWVSEITSIPGVTTPSNLNFGKEKDVFPAFGENTIESLIASIAFTSDSTVESYVQICQKIMLNTASLDGILRILVSEFSRMDPSVAEALVQETITDISRSNISSFISGLPSRSKHVVTTFTPLHFFSTQKDIPEGIRDSTFHRKLEAFDTESSLVNAVRSFYSNPSLSILIFDCHSQYDRDVMLLAKFIVDREESEWEKLDLEGIQKTVIFLVHVSRTHHGDGVWELCFSAGWNFTQIDNLILPSELWDQVQEMVTSGSVLDVLSSQKRFSDLVRLELVPCFSCLQYRVPILQSLGETQASRVLRICSSMSDDFFEILKEKIQDEITRVTLDTNFNFQVRWMVHVALDRELLELCSFSFVDAVPSYLRKIVHLPLLKLLYLLESHSSTEIYASIQSEPFFKAIFLSDSILGFSSFPTSGGPTVYEVDAFVSELSFPFSKFIVQQFDDLRQAFLSEYSSIQMSSQTEESYDPLFDDDKAESLRRRYFHSLERQFEEVYQNLGSSSFAQDFRGDFLGDFRLRRDLIRFFVKMSNLMTAERLDSQINHVLEILSLLIAGNLTTFNENSPPNVIVIMMLLWEFDLILSSLLEVLEFINTLDSNLHVLELIQAPIRQYLESCSETNPPQSRRLIMLISYHVACFACKQHISQLCSSRTDRQTLQNRLHGTISMLQLLIQRSCIPLGDETSTVDPDCRLLHLFYVLHVFRDLSSYDTEECERRIFSRGMNDLILMNPALFDLISSWLSPIALDQSSSEIELVGGMLCTIMNWFLYVSACCDPSTSIISTPLFTSIIGCLSSLRHDPPISISKPLTIIMMNVFETIESHYSLLGADCCELISSRRFPDQLVESLAEFNQFCGTIRGTKLEILILDLILSKFTFGPLEGDNYEERCAHFLESVESNILAHADYEDHSFFILYLSHALMKNFLSLSGIKLMDGTISDGDVAILNRIFDPHRPQVDSSELKMLRIFFIKCLGSDFRTLTNCCSEGGKFCDFCPWLSTLPWPDPSGISLIAINPGEQNPNYSQSESAWNACHEVVPNPEPLRDYIDSIFDELDEIQAMTRLSGLMWTVFVKVCSPIQLTQRELEGLSFFQPLQNSQYNSVKRVSHFITLSSQRFSCLREYLPETNAIFMPLVSCILGIVTGSNMNPQNLLARYLQDISLGNNHFVVGADSFSTMSIWNKLGGNKVQRSKCKCGSLFWYSTPSSDDVDTSVSIICRCRNAKLELIQSLDTIDPETDPFGFYFSLPKREDPASVVRLLSPAHYRILCVLVHGTIIASHLSEINSESILSKSDECFLSWNWFATSWKILCDSLVPSTSQDLLLIAFHSFLNEFYSTPELNCLTASEEERLRWEAEFSIICSKYFDDIFQFSPRVSEFRILPLSPIENDLLECPPSALFYRTISIDTGLSRMTDSYYSKSANIQNFPLIHLVLCHRNNLKLISHLGPLLAWTNQLRKHKNLLYSRDEVRSISNESLLQEPNSPFDIETYQRAEYSWNSLWEDFCDLKEDRHIILFDGIELLMSKMTPTSPLSLSCLGERGDGLLISVLLNYLASLQNSFLDQVHSMLVSSAKGNGVSTIRDSQEVALQEASDPHLVSFDESKLWMELEIYGRRSLEYGSCQFEFDFKSVEKVFLHHLVQNKAILIRCAVNEMIPMRFKNEIFSNYNKMMDSFLELIPQERFQETENIKQDLFLRDINEVSNHLLPSVESLFYIITESKEPVDGEMLIVDYANIWSKDVNSRRMEKYRSNSIIGRLQLKHLEHFYEILEEKMSEIVLKHIESRNVYSQPILEEFRTSVLTDTISFLDGDGKLLMASLTRFIVRYLRKPSPIDPNAKLSEYAHLFRFPSGKHILTQTPDHLKAQWHLIHVGQSLTILKEIDRRVKAEDEAKRRSERLHSNGFQPSPSLKQKASNPVAKALTKNKLRNYKPGL
jgi:hypothetical protein